MFNVIVTEKERKVKMEEVTPQKYYEPPRKKMYCYCCDDIIERDEKYIDFNEKPYCMRCFSDWLYDHTMYNE